MIFFSFIYVIQLISVCAMCFFWGMSLQITERTRRMAHKLWMFFLTIVWICILIRQGGIIYAN